MMRSEVISSSNTNTDEASRSGVAVYDRPRPNETQPDSAHHGPSQQHASAQQRGSIQRETASSVNSSQHSGEATTSDALPADTELHSGSFRISRVLGRDAVGITYLSRNVSLHRDVVIKEFFPPGALRARSGSGGRNVNEVVPAGQDHGQYYQQTRAAFLEKSRAVSRVWHPNVVMVYDTFEENNTAYMVMKLLKGKTLQQFLEEQLAQKRFLPQAQVLAYALHIGRGLGALHKEGLVHGDVYPANVMLCPPSENTPQHDPAVAQRRAPLEKVPTDEWTLSGQRIVLLDCGLNRLPATSDGAQTQWLGDRRRAGRSAYAPPELFGGGRETGPTTDVYALGATLYHMLTGEAPVEAPSRALGTVLQPPHRANVRINPALSEAVMWALELRSEHRPPTVEAFLNQLSQCGSEAPVRQAPLSAAQTTSAPPKKVLSIPQAKQVSAKNGVAPVTARQADAFQVPTFSTANKEAGDAAVGVTSNGVAPNGSAPATGPVARPTAEPASPTLPAGTKSSREPGGAAPRRNNGRHLALAALLGTAIAGTAGWALWREATTRPKPVVPAMSRKATRPEDTSQRTPDTTSGTANTSPRAVAIPPATRSEPVERSMPVDRNQESQDTPGKSGSTTIASKAPTRRAGRRAATQQRVNTITEERSRRGSIDVSGGGDREVNRRRSRRALRRSRETDDNPALSNSAETRDAREGRERRDTREAFNTREPRDTQEARDTRETPSTREGRTSRRNLRQRRREDTREMMPRVLRNTREQRRLRRTTREADLPPQAGTSRGRTRTNATRNEAGLPPM